MELSSPVDLRRAKACDVTTKRRISSTNSGSKLSSGPTSCWSPDHQIESVSIPAITRYSRSYDLSPRTLITKVPLLSNSLRHWKTLSRETKGSDQKPDLSIILVITIRNRCNAESIS